MVRFFQYIVFLYLLTFSSAIYAQQQYRTFVAHSGRIVKIMSTGPMFFGKNKALRLQYLSEYSVGDKANLNKEISEIWPSFKVDVERAGFTQAIISANEISKSLPFGISQSRSFNVGFEKTPSGKWRCHTEPSIVKGDELLQTAITMREKGQYGNVINCLNELLVLWPNCSECYLDRAVGYLMLHDPRKALLDCNKAIKLRPEYDAAYTNRGVVYGTLGEFDLALKDFDHALKINPSLASAHADRGELYLKKNKLDEAIKDLTASINENPTNGESYYYRAEAYKKTGNKTNSEKDLQKAKTLNYTPDSDIVLAK